jgi:hypothetical protein
MVISACAQAAARRRSHMHTTQDSQPAPGSRPLQASPFPHSTHPTQSKHMPEKTPYIRDIRERMPRSDNLACKPMQHAAVWGSCATWQQHACTQNIVSHACPYWRRVAPLQHDAARVVVCFLVRHRYTHTAPHVVAQQCCCTGLNSHTKTHASTSCGTVNRVVAIRQLNALHVVGSTEHAGKPNTGSGASICRDNTQGNTQGRQGAKDEH